MATRVDKQGQYGTVALLAGVSQIMSMRDRARGPAQRRMLPGPGEAARPAANADDAVRSVAEFVMHGGIGIARGSIATGIVWANDCFSALSGYDRETIAAQGLDWTAITPLEWQAEDRARLATARSSGYSPTFEKKLLRSDGTHWPVICAYAVDADDDELITVFVVDLSASKSAEALRNAAERRYARFFDVANVVFWTSDAKGRLTFSSTTAFRLGTSTRLEVLERQAELVHPEDRALATGTWRDSLASGNAYDIRVRTRGLETADYRWTWLRGFPERDSDGAIVGWYGTSEDIHERRVATLALAESEVRFRQLADDMPVVVWLTELDGNASYLSSLWYELTGQTEAQALGRGWLNAICREDRARLEPVRGFVDRGESFSLDFRLICADGQALWMVSSGRPRRAADGTILGYAGSLTDIHARKTAESELANLQTRLSRALDGTGVGVWEWDAATDSVMISGSALVISGFAASSEEYQSVDYRAAVHRDDRDRLQSAMTAYIENTATEFEVEIRVYNKQRGWVWVLDRGTATARDADGRATHMVGTLTNIDDAKRAEAKLRWTVEHDALTGLANRRLFQTRLEAATAEDGDCALVLLDIDDFKMVNDVHGHAAGDALLLTLAERLCDFAYPHETVARLGGDEFTLIIPRRGSVEQLMARLETLRHSLTESFGNDGVILNCRSSIGVALSPEHGTDASALLKNADIAMYSAKHRQRGAVAMFDPAFGAKLRCDLERITAIRTALGAGLVAPCYEPIVRLADGAVIGFEAMPHIVGGRIDPIDIHELASAFNEADLAGHLGRCLLDQALSDFAQWLRAGCAPEFVALNVSLAELRQIDFAQHLNERLAAFGILPAQLRLDVAETDLNDRGGRNRSAAALDALSKSGFQVGLDNFGAGSASLSHLTQLTLSALKIDAQFIRHATVPGSEQSVIRAVLGLAASLGLRSVALGIETAAQAAKLLELGCVMGQGKLYGEAADATATLAGLRSRRPV